MLPAIPTRELTPHHVEALLRLESRLSSLLRDLRLYRQELSSTLSDKGVLGSRGLTEYLLLLLRSRAEGEVELERALAKLRLPAHQRSTASSLGLSIRELMSLADQAGYAIPTRAVLAKRLNARAYSWGDVRFEPERGVWRWVGGKAEEEYSTYNAATTRKEHK